MKTFFVGFLLLLTILIQAKTPEWVKYYNSEEHNFLIEDHYFGIGVGTDFSNSDRESFSEFGKNVELKVSTTIDQKVSEINNRLNDEFSISTLQISDVILRGISISDRYYDANSDNYYSLIYLTKDEYNLNFERELALELQREKFEVNQQIERLRINEKMKKEEIRQRQISLRLEKEKKIQQEKEKEFYLEQFADFYNYDLGSSLVSIPSAELEKSFFTLSGNSILDPFEWKSFFVGVRLGRIQAKVKAKNERKVMGETEFKILILDNVGDVLKIYFSGGYKTFDFSLEENIDTVWDNAFDKGSVFISSSVLIPQLSSAVTIHFDEQICGLGIEYFLFPSFWDDSVRFLCNAVYIDDKRLRNVSNTKVYLEPGLRFKMNNNLILTTVYELNDRFAMDLSWNF